MGYTDMRDPGLDAQQRRNALRDLVQGRGPDAGRRINHLKFRSLDPALQEMIEQTEGFGLMVPDAGMLTGADGTSTVVYFVSDWSQSEGTDVTA